EVVAPGGGAWPRAEPGEQRQGQPAADEADEEDVEVGDRQVARLQGRLREAEPPRRLEDRLEAEPEGEPANRPGAAGHGGARRLPQIPAADPRGDEERDR